MSVTSRDNGTWKDRDADVERSYAEWGIAPKEDKSKSKSKD